MATTTTPRSTPEPEATPVSTPKLVAAKTPKKRLSGADMTGGSLLLLSLLVLAGSLYMGWKAMQPSSYASNLPAMATPTPKTVVPTLKLNQVHQRAGAPITVDPQSIGKTNPFQ